MRLATFVCPKCDAPPIQATPSSTVEHRCPVTHRIEQYKRLEEVAS